MSDLKIIVLQGPPACGKSTKAKELLNEYGADEAVIVCRDSIRESCGEYWVPSREDYITDLEYFTVKNALAHNLIPIIDATNLNPKTIAKWKTLAATYDADIEWIEVVVPYSEALKRNSNPDRARPVDKKVLRSFYTRYYPEMIAPLTDERKMIEFTSKPKAIIVDIDGTIALRDGRSPFDYDKAYNDKADHRMAHLLKNLIDECEYKVFFVTGREDIGDCRRITTSWLNDNIYSQVWYNMGIPRDNWVLLMRAEGDHRSDDIVKKEIYEKSIAPWHDVVAVFDDRDKVVKMWRDLGLLCCQVYYGDF